MSWKGEGSPQPAARAAAGTRGKQTGRTRNSQWKGCAEGRGALKRERERERERERDNNNNNKLKLTTKNKGGIPKQAELLGRAVSCISSLRPTASFAYGHTTLNTPDLVRSRKLSRVGPG